VPGAPARHRATAPAPTPGSP